jgi:2-oxoglutarate dehydrogenase E1 component
MAKGERPLDWGPARRSPSARCWSRASPVRLSGQDSRARHLQPPPRRAVDEETGALHPARHARENQARFEVYNSPLSEIAVLGFEYGYSLDTPEGLVIWEAQFGDFVNGAQVIIDQFIVSGEDKWNRLSGLVMLLPHGFEGQGPEHSAARASSASCSSAPRTTCRSSNLTTPAHYFHVLRRQVRARRGASR